MGPFMLKNESIFPYWRKKFTDKKRIALIKNIIAKKIAS
jgi:hypothetical protein